MVSGLALLAWASWSADSPLRGPSGSLADFKAPLMQSIVPLIFLLFWIPGAVYGFTVGTFKTSKEI